jgi:hypothetical protein
MAQVVERIAGLDRLMARTCPSGARTKKQATVRLSDVLDIRLGGVTGDADYFVLTESQRKQHELPKTAVRPVVSRSRHIIGPLMRQASFEELRQSDESIWLFRPSKPNLNHPAVKRYLGLNVKEGGCHRDRYKIRKRRPWYITPMPDSVDGFVSGMTSRGLWICMNEFPGLNATNTLYVATFLNTPSRAQRYAWALSLLTTPVVKQISRSMRIYADGLRKLEPGQIGRLEVPIPPKLRNAVSLYHTACNKLLRGEESHARLIADEVILEK